MGTWQHWNVTKDAAYFPQIRTFGISDGRPCALMTMSGHVPVGQVDNEDEIEARYAADDVTFVKVGAGDALVTEQAHLIRAVNTVIPFSAQDFTARLDWTVITAGKRNVTESITARVNWLLSITPLHGIGNGGVETMAGLIGPDDYTGLTKRQALDRVRGMVNGLYYVDLDKETIFYLQDDPPTNSAPFELGYPRNPPTVYDYDQFSLRTDAMPRGDEINVRGAEGLAVWRPTDPPSGGRQAVLNVPSATTIDQLTMLGDAWLARYGTALRSGSLRTYQPGLQSGQTVHIENSEHAIDEDWIITQVNVTPLIGNEVGGDAHGLASFAVDFAKTVTCTGNIGDVLNDLQRDPPKPDCSICPRTLVLLPDGMGDNLSLARGQAGMHVYDGTKLVAYDCNVAKVREKASAPSALSLIYHEPGIYTGLLAGDRVFHLDPDLGAYGTTRWSIDDAIAAADVMDIRRFWAVGSDAPVFDDFNRTTSAGSLGSAPEGGAWALTNPVGLTTYVRADGSRYEYDNSTSSVSASVSARQQDGGPWTADFTLLVGPFDLNAAAISTGTLLQLAVGWAGPRIQAYIGQSGADWTVNVSDTGGGGTSDAAVITTPTADALYWFKWNHDYGGNSQAKVWADGTAEPAYQAVRDASGDSAPSDDEFYLRVNCVGGAGRLRIDQLDFGLPQLQSRSMVDGSLIASAALSDSTTQIRRTPNGQHVFVLQGTDTLKLYKRSVALEDTVTIAGFATGLQEWNVDDAYNFYRLADNVLERYDETGSLDWSKDLNALYGYRYPSLPTWSGGTGQQVVTHDNRLRVIGYAGGADWLDGSDAILLSLHPVSGGLISNRHIAGGATDAAQAIALEPLGRCLWIAGAADGDEIDGVALSGPSKWLLPLDEGDSGGVVGLAIGEDV